MVVVDADLAQLAHAWKVDAHVLAIKTNLSDGDAIGLHGRTVTVGAAGFSTPWHGTCEEANRERRARQLAEITAEADLSQSNAAAVKGFGLLDPVVEYRLSCKDFRTRVPALTIFVGGTTAMTCFGGACYMLKR